jgi:type IV secretory pathway VirB2 component (pilin)
MDSVNGQVILAGHKAMQWQERHKVTFPTTRRAAFVWGMAAAAVAIGQDALAQAGGTGTAPAPGKTNGPNIGNQTAQENGNPFVSINTGICTMTNWLRGPVGIGLVLMAIIVAGISLAVGGKKSTSTLIAALAGAAVILGARSIMSLASGNQTNICTPTGAAAPVK